MQKMSNLSIGQSYKNNKKLSFSICFGVYFIALVIAIITTYFLHKMFHPLLVVLSATVLATVIIYLFSLLFDNASLYDPYWSVAPVPMIIYYITISNITISWRQWIVLSLVLIWSARLTFNWARQWQNLAHQDWRYIHLKSKNPKLFWLVNLVGIQLFPTILVYLGSLALYPIFSYQSALNFIDFLAMIVTSLAIIIETIADQQRLNFLKKRNDSDSVLSTGLWSVSRHPNYFGEISFWCGLYIFALATNSLYWWTVVGPISMILLFNFVSIPLMENRQIERKPEYKEYRKRVSRLIPWFKKK